MLFSANLSSKGAIESVDALTQTHGYRRLQSSCFADLRADLTIEPWREQCVHPSPWFTQPETIIEISRCNDGG